jgi:hypothetical protein
MAPGFQRRSLQSVSRLAILRLLLAVIALGLKVLCKVTVFYLIPQIKKSAAHLERLIFLSF